MACLALYPLARLWPGGDAPVVVPQVGLALVALAVFWGGQSGVLEDWVFVLPSVFLGLAFALARGHRGRLLTAAGLSIAVLGIAGLQGWNPLGVAQQGLATAALVLCLVIRLPETPFWCSARRCRSGSTCRTGWRPRWSSG